MSDAFVCVVENTSTGETRELALRVDTWPKFVGSGAACELHVPELGQKEARLDEHGIGIFIITAHTENVHVPGFGPRVAIGFQTHCHTFEISGWRFRFQSFICVIENTTGEARKIVLRDEPWPKFVGSGADCELCVPELAENAARLDPYGDYRRMFVLTAYVENVCIFDVVGQRQAGNRANINSKYRCRTFEIAGWKFRFPHFG